MVRVAHTAYFGTGAIRTATRKHINGCGAGGVVLNNGLGGGSGGSYASLDDYINTTGVNPLRNQPSSLGRGIHSMNKKIEELLVKSKKHSSKKDKNINFNI